jgi:hypothetical protein
MALKVIEWARRRLGMGKDETVMDDREFERLFGKIEKDAQTALNFESVWAALLDTDRYLKEEAGKIRDMNLRMQKVVEDLERQFGKRGRALDETFVTSLERRFNILGFFFQRASERALFGNREYPSCYAEVDLFLENSNRAVAVAVRGPPCVGVAVEEEAVATEPAGLAEANIDDIREHLERMEKLRRHFDLNNDRRELYGAVAAERFPKDALGFALYQGFYAIEYTGERMEVRKPQGEARVW